MSVHKSLKTGSSMKGHRSVLTRAERVARLEEEGRFEGKVVGIPKVKNQKAAKGKKK